MPENDHESLSRKARNAVLGFSSTPAQDLAELFRSDAPIDGLLRGLIAQALTTGTTTGSSLHFTGINPKAKGYHVRREWFEVGAWIDQQAAPYQTVMEEAEAKFCKSRKYCEKAHTFAREVMAWVSSVNIPGTYYGDWPEEILIERYIGFSIDGATPPPNKSAEQVALDNERNLKVLREIFGDDT